MIKDSKIKTLKYLPVFLLLFSCNYSSESSIDSFFSKLNVLTMKKNAILSNINNVNTTRTPSGGPYIPIEATNCINGICNYVALESVGIGAIPNSPRVSILKYEPSHPDAKRSGYVTYPNINLIEENSKLVRINLAIEFLLKELPVSHDFFFSEKSQKIFNKYQAINNYYNFKRLLEE